MCLVKTKMELSIKFCLKFWNKQMFNFKHKFCFCNLFGDGAPEIPYWASTGVTPPLQQQWLQKGRVLSPRLPTVQARERTRQQHYQNQSVTRIQPRGLAFIFSFFGCVWSRAGREKSQPGRTLLPCRFLPKGRLSSLGISGTLYSVISAETRNPRGSGESQATENQTSWTLGSRPESHNDNLIILGVDTL